MIHTMMQIQHLTVETKWYSLLDDMKGFDFTDVIHMRMITNYL